MSFGRNLGTPIPEIPRPVFIRWSPDKADQASCTPEVPSGYLKDSALPKVTVICYRSQAFNAKIYWNIGLIRNHMVMVDAGGISGNCASV
jgi:hypothetical protein